MISRALILELESMQCHTSISMSDVLFDFVLSANSINVIFSVKKLIYMMRSNLII